MNSDMVAGNKSLVDRVKAIILKPKDEWPVIAAEQTSQMQILTGYVLILAAIGPVANFIGSQVFGYGVLGITWRPSFMSALMQAIVSYVLTIVGVFVLGFIADFLAPKFDGQSDKLNAFKLVAYGATASWLSGIFGLVPMLAVFGLLGLYSLYLFYTGVGPLMKVPAEKALGYTVVTFLCGIAIFIVVGFIAGRMVGPPSASVLRDSGEMSGSINIPGVGSIDTGKMEEAAERMEKIQKGEIKPASAEDLQALLPGSIGGFERTGKSSTALGQMGTGVEGKYSSGDYQFDLGIRDMAGLSGLAGIGAAMGVQQSEEDETGYERIGVFDGEWLSEKWDNTNNRGRYAIMVADRFQIEASGRVESIDVLKSAVAAIDKGDLEDLSGE